MPTSSLSVSIINFFDVEFLGSANYCIGDGSSYLQVLVEEGI